MIRPALMSGVVAPKTLPAALFLQAFSTPTVTPIPAGVQLDGNMAGGEARTADIYSIKEGVKFGFYTELVPFVDGALTLGLADTDSNITSALHNWVGFNLDTSMSSAAPNLVLIADDVIYTHLWPTSIDSTEFLTQSCLGVQVSGTNVLVEIWWDEFGTNTSASPPTVSHTFSVTAGEAQSLLDNISRGYGSLTDVLNQYDAPALEYDGVTLF